MATTRPPPPVEPEESRVTDPVTADLSGVHPWSDPGEPSRPGAPLAATPWPGTNPTHEEERPVARGDSIGRYVVLHEVGRGGMGVVYAAYDAELDRKVAIKVLRGSSGNAARDHDRQARLLREAQAMARVDHPNVLSVFDVGTFRGQVFVAMAFVDGTNLSSYIRDATHPWREALELFCAAGRGLAAAHGVGLVHRDFKPANVLLARDGRVFVTDFGLARLTGHEEPPSLPSPVEERLVGEPPKTGLQAEMTREGAVVGTPTYMAPEQHVGRQADARSDQFSFCATLYWALWHKRPFEPAMLAAAAFRRFGGANTVPQRVAQGGAAALDQVSVIAEPPREVRVPARVRRAIMRGLSLDPDERFPNMEALLGQLSLERRQLQARWTAAGAGFLLTVSAIALVLQQRAAARAEVCSGAPARLKGKWDPQVEASMKAAFVRVAKERGEVAAERASRAISDYADRWAAGFREACEATRLRREVDDRMMELRMLCLDRRLKELEALTLLFQAPDEAMVEKSVEATASLSSVRQCQELETLHLKGRPDDPARSRAVAQVESQLAQIRALKAAGRLAQAGPLAQAAVGAAAPLNYRPLEAEARLLLGYLEASDPQAAERDLFKAFFLAEAGHDDYTKVEAATRLVYQLRDKYDRAMEWAQHARSGIDRVGGSPDLEVGLINNLSTVHLQAAHYAEAVSAIQQGLAVVDLASGREVHRMNLLANLGAGYMYLGDRERAVSTMREALQAMTDLRGPDHPVQISTLRNMSLLQAQQGDYRGALEAAAKAVKIALERVGPESLKLGDSLDSMGTVLLMDRHPAEALERFEEAAKIKAKAAGPDSQDVAYSLDGVGQALVSLGRPKEALPNLEKASKILTGAGDPEQLAETQFHLAQALVAARADPSRARSLALQARSGFIATNVPDKAQEVSRWLAEVRR